MGYGFPDDTVTSLLSEADSLRASGETLHEGGDSAHALLFFDAAIDLYLRAGDAAAAASLCEVVVALAPNGVRARCTLAWLAVLLAPAPVVVRRIAQYAEAAQTTGASERACRQLRCMAEECDDASVLDVIGGALLHLGDTPGANRVFGRIYERSSPARVYENEADRERVVTARLTLAIPV